MEEYKARLIAFSRCETEAERQLIRHMMTQAEVAPSISSTFAEEGKAFDLIEEATAADGEIEDAKDTQSKPSENVSNLEIQSSVLALHNRQEQTEESIKELTGQISKLNVGIGSIMDILNGNGGVPTEVLDETSGSSLTERAGSFFHVPGVPGSQ
jgi:hypothetical protein